jgi:hypothetical protein
LIFLLSCSSGFVAQILRLLPWANGAAAAASRSIASTGGNLAAQLGGDRPKLIGDCRGVGFSEARAHGGGGPALGGAFRDAPGNERFHDHRPPRRPVDPLARFQPRRVEAALTPL